MPEAIEIAIAWAIVIGSLGAALTVFTSARARFRAASHPPGADPQEVAELRETVQRLAGDLSDLQDRVDFAERLLAKQREAERLKG